MELAYNYEVSKVKEEHLKIENSKGMNMKDDFLTKVLGPRLLLEAKM